MPQNQPNDPVFRTSFGEHRFNDKYKHEGCETWEKLSNVVVDDVVGGLIPKDLQEYLTHQHTEMKVIAGGRYLYYAGRPAKFWNNCFLLKALEDSREDWSDLMQRVASCLMTGGGIGTVTSVYRPNGAILSKTGGIASGPLSMIRALNEIGREVRQGGSRRSAAWSGLHWWHDDIFEFMRSKNWQDMKIGDTNLGELKGMDPDFPCPLDMTNISVIYENDFLEQVSSAFNNPSVERGEVLSLPEVWMENVHQAMRTGEPGMSFNFFDKEGECLRNACGESTSRYDSNMCNLGSLNMSRIDDINEWRDLVKAFTVFLLCGSIRSHLPYDKCAVIRDYDRRIGLGLMGVHEWLLKRNYGYEMVPELRQWMEIYRDEAKNTGDEWADRLGISRPTAWHAVAPAGTIGILAGTTTGADPLFASAYKRRFVTEGDVWKHEYVLDGTARLLNERYGINPDDIETANDLSFNIEKQVKFQADLQDYVSQGISTTINLPAWGSEFNNEDQIESNARILASYAHRLRGMTFYPDGGRCGQPMTKVGWNYAKSKVGKTFVEQTHDICDITGRGSCAV